MRSTLKRGQFITLEGIEGAGKSTVLPVIERVLQRSAIDFTMTREPGGTVLAEKIRAVFLEPSNEVLEPMTELLLVFASRHQHVTHLIKPALAAGQWVVSDRFTATTYAYQGGGRGLNKEIISTLEKLVLGHFEPNHTLLLDIPATLAKERIAARCALDRIEQETLEFFERIRQSYLTQAAQFPERYAIIDATQSPEHVSQQVNTILQQWIKAW